MDIRPVSLTKDREIIFALAETILEADPRYAPTVSTGAETLETWFLKKKNVLGNGVFLEGELVGYVGLREAQHYRKRYELCRLIVHPDFRGEGFAEELVKNSFKSFADEMWAATIVQSPGHNLFLKFGWQELGPIVFDDDPNPGVILAPTNSMKEYNGKL